MLSNGELWRSATLDKITGGMARRVNQHQLTLEQFNSTRNLLIRARREPDDAVLRRYLAKYCPSD